MPRLVMVVAAALVNAKNEVLLAQRPEGKAMAGLWEFPGGKIEIGEIPEATLARELQEELGLSVKLEDMKPFRFVSHAYPNFHLFMPLYTVSNWQGEPTAREGQVLAWANARDLQKYLMPAADVPLAAELARFLAANEGRGGIAVISGLRALFFGSRARSGATAIEYGLIIGLIAFGIFGLTSNFGTSVAGFFERITPVFDDADPT